MGVFNQDAVNSTVAVSSMALGIWGEEAQQAFIATDVISPNPALRLNEGKIYKLDNKRDQTNDKPTGALESGSSISLSKDSVDYKRMPYRTTFIINPDEFSKDLTREEAELEQEQLGMFAITRNRRSLFESIIANKIFNTSNFNNTGASTAWATVASANPVLDINTSGGLVSIARSIKPNAVIFGATAWKNYLANEKVKASMKNIDDAVVRRDRALDLMRSGHLENLQDLHVAEASYNTANSGQTEVRGYIWPPTLVWVGYIEKKPSSKYMLGALGLSMSTQKDSLGKDSPVHIRKYRNESHQLGVNVLEGMIDFDLAIIDSAYGQIITTT